MPTETFIALSVILDNDNIGDDIVINSRHIISMRSVASVKTEIRLVNGVCFNVLGTLQDITRKLRN